MRTALAAFFLILLKIYRLTGSWVGFRSPCRFYPSCSVYASEAIKRYGAFRGAWTTLGRLTRCHPWSLGGIDLPETENR